MIEYNQVLQLLGHTGFKAKKSCYKSHGVCGVVDNKQVGQLVLLISPMAKFDSVSIQMLQYALYAHCAMTVFL